MEATLLKQTSPVTAGVPEKIAMLEKETGISVLKDWPIEELQTAEGWAEFSREEPRRANVIRLLAEGHQLVDRPAAPELVDASIDVSVANAISSNAFRQLVRAEINIGEYVEYLKSRSLQFRDHQENVFKEIADWLTKHEDRGWIRLPTGAGKTAIFLSLIEGWTGNFGDQKELNQRTDPEHKAKTLIVVPSVDLVKQTAKECGRFADSVSASQYFGGAKNLEGDVVITTYQSLANVADEAKRRGISFELVICDEAHRGLTPSRQSALESIPGRAVTIGFTATPDFEAPGVQEIISPDEEDSVEKAKSVQAYFGTNIASMNLTDAIPGILCDVISHVVIVKGEKLDPSLFGASGEAREDKVAGLDTEFRHQKVLELMTGEHKGASFAVSDVTVDQGQKLARDCQKAGITVCMIWGEIDKSSFSDVLDLHSIEKERSIIKRVQEEIETQLKDSPEPDKVKYKTAAERFEARLQEELLAAGIDGLTSPARVVVDVQKARYDRRALSPAPRGDDLDEWNRKTSFRDMLTEAQREGLIQGRIFKDCGIEGWDSPRTSVLFNLRPTLSQVVSEQRLGRVLRKFEGKENAIVYDFAPEDGQLPLLAGHILRAYYERIAIEGKVSEGGTKPTPKPKDEKEVNPGPPQAEGVALDEKQRQRLRNAADVVQLIDTRRLAQRSLGVDITKEMMEQALEATAHVPFDRIMNEEVVVHGGRSSKQYRISFGRVLAAHRGISEEDLADLKEADLRDLASKVMKKEQHDGYLRVRVDVSEIQRAILEKDPRNVAGINLAQREIITTLNNRSALTFDAARSIETSAIHTGRFSINTYCRMFDIRTAADFNRHLGGQGKGVVEGNPGVNYDIVSPLRIEAIAQLKHPQSQRALEALLAQADTLNNNPDIRIKISPRLPTVTVREFVMGAISAAAVVPHDPAEQERLLCRVCKVERSGNAWDSELLAKFKKLLSDFKLDNFR